MGFAYVNVLVRGKRKEKSFEKLVDTYSTYIYLLMRRGFRVS